MTPADQAARPQLARPQVARPYVSAEMLHAGAMALAAFSQAKSSVQLVLNPLDLTTAIPAVYRAMHALRFSRVDHTAAERKRRQRAKLKGG